MTQTLLLSCLAWFMPLHALDAATGQWHSAEAAEFSSTAETAWVAGDSLDRYTGAGGVGGARGGAGRAAAEFGVGGAAVGARSRDGFGRSPD